MVQDRAKSGLEVRNSFNSWKRRILWLSSAVKLLASGIVVDASRMELPRWLAARNIKVGLPSNWVTTALRENTTRAKGREKRAKIMPANSAMIRMTAKLSPVTRILV